MKVRRYFAANMRSALEMARVQQGTDVLILSNRKMEDGVELITADGDVDDSMIDTMAKSSKSEARVSASRQNLSPSIRQIDNKSDRKPLNANREAQAGATNASDSVDNILWTDEATMQKMHLEMESIKGLLEQQLGGLAWSDYGSKHPGRARLLRTLSRMGVAPDLGRDIVEKIPDGLNFKQAWIETLEILRRRVPILENPILSSGGTVALCGPTGVGKTTLVCKLAARFGLEHGTEQVAVISLDDRRLGAHQQLQIFARLSGIEVLALTSEDSLAEKLALLRKKRAIIIDTPGYAPDDIRFRELLSDLREIKTYLTLSATTDYNTQIKNMKLCAEMNVDACVLTKLDEAALLGPALSALIEVSCPVAYISTGQAMPDDFEVANSQNLVTRSVAMAGENLPKLDPSALERAFV